MNTPPLFELSHVQQHYVNGTRLFVAVQDINLQLYEGEFVALLGPSGCGKSTLLRLITGLQKPSEGLVLYHGQPLHGVNPHTTIVFQTFALFPWLTALENVELALHAHDLAPAVRALRALDLLDRVGLDGFENAYPRELSGGMRQKVGFARAMAVEPELLCLDEPFSALDVLSAEALRHELLELWTAGGIPTKAILMVSHNIEEAVLMADRIVVMDKSPGRIIAELKIDLPHPRPRQAEAFRAAVNHVYALLAGQTNPEAQELGSVPGFTRALPLVTLGNLTGLVEYLADQLDDQADIYQVAAELKIDSDHVLSLSETAELLEFATIAKGKLHLTPLGETFAEASILARKEIFAARIRRLPLVHWLLSLLQRADKRQLNWEMLKAALELEFPPAEAEKQIGTLIHWGRYAELLTYDKGTGKIYLEHQPEKRPA